MVVLRKALGGRVNTSSCAHERLCNPLRVQDVLWGLVLYSATYIPLEMVFEDDVQYPGWDVIDSLLILVFATDMIVKARAQAPLAPVSKRTHARGLWTCITH